ncbi:MAG: RDD family protein [Acidimicrobiales bacterium]
MSDLPPPPGAPPPPPPPPPSGGAPPDYVTYGQNQGLQAQFAGFWIRFAAAFIDGLLIAVPLAILGTLVGAYDTTTTDAFGNEVDSTSFRVSYGFTPGAPLWFNLLNTAVGVAYYGALEGGATGQTLGKRATGIRVVSASTGQPGIGVGRAIGRYFARILSAIPCALGYLWMLWDGKKQTWHDKIVGSYVVKA